MAITFDPTWFVGPNARVGGGIHLDANEPVIDAEVKPFGMDLLDHKNPIQAGFRVGAATDYFDQPVTRDKPWSVAGIAECFFEFGPWGLKDKMPAAPYLRARVNVGAAGSDEASFRLGVGLDVSFLILGSPMIALMGQADKIDDPHPQWLPMAGVQYTLHVNDRGEDHVVTGGLSVEADLLKD